METKSAIRPGPGSAISRFYPGRWSGLLPVAAVLVALAATGCTKIGGASTDDRPEPQPLMSIELPGGEFPSLPFVVSGWALDLSSVDDSGIDAVQILDEGCEGAVIGIAEYGLERPDIASEHGEQFLHSGWELEVERLRSGDHTLAVRARSAGADEYDQCEAIQITLE